MPLQSHTLTFKTDHPLEIRDLSTEVKEFVTRHPPQDGLLIVASLHTTVGVVMNERCEELQKDMVEFLKKWAPPESDYRHNRVAVDGRPNAHSHLLSLVIPSQVTIVVSQGRLQMGPWQSIFAVELDGPRPERKIELTWVGL